jgi:hypothetical protein
MLRRSLSTEGKADAAITNDHGRGAMPDDFR